MNEQVGHVPASELRHETVEPILERYSESLGPFRSVSLAESGFIIQRKKSTPSKLLDWIFFDYDDTLVGTTQAKAPRLQLFTEYIQKKLGSQMSDDEIGQLMDGTDRFARWEESPGGGEMYHAKAHILSLSWITDELEKSSEPSSTTKDLQAKLTRIKDQVGQGSDVQEGVEPEPFYFNNVNKLIPLENYSWNDAIEKIIDLTLIHPPEFEETIEAAKKLKAGNDSNGFNLGILTYGDPGFQLLKVMELMRAHPKMDISQIWLTKVPKGKFIRTAMLHDYPKKEIKNSQRLVPPAIIFVDDSPKELDSVLNANTVVAESSGSEWIPVRSLRKDTREEHKDWQGSEVFVLNMKDEALAADEIVAKIQKVRQTAWERRLEKVITYEVDSEIKHGIKSLQNDAVGQYFTEIKTGQDTHYNRIAMLHKDIVKMVQGYKNKKVSVITGEDDYQYMYEENEEQSHKTIYYNGELIEVTRDGVLLANVTGLSEQKGINGDFPFAKKRIFIPFRTSEFHLREMAHDRSIASILTESGVLTFSRDAVRFTEHSLG